MPEKSHLARSPSSLLLSLDDQDRRFSTPFEIIREAIAQRVFPAAAVGVTHRSRLVVLKSFGTLVYQEDLAGEPPAPRLFGPGVGVPEVTAATLFDLASVTKPMATTTMAMILYERGQLNLDAPVEGTVPEFTGAPSDSRRRTVTFHHLLTHSSGLPAYEKLFLKAPTRDELLRAAFAVPLTADPGCRAEYSDIGFIILGVALERLAEESLDAFCQREIFGPLGMSNTTFNPPPALRPGIPPTADERTRSGASAGGSTPRSTFRERIIQGEVQDENASALGGVAGHAGLFSTSEDVARFAQTLLLGGSPILGPETISLFTRRQPSPTGTSRTLGWDTPSAPSQSGKYFGPRSYGHLGYTGTSLWIDPDRQLAITVLTNRTWPDCSSRAIQQLRPRFHDAIIEALG